MDFVKLMNFGKIETAVEYSHSDAVIEKPESAEWIPLGHRIGAGKHPWSRDYKCPVCGYEQYTLCMDPPNICVRCRTKMTGVKAADAWDHAGEG